MDRRNQVEKEINYNNYKQVADKIIQALDKIYNSALSDKRWVWELMQNANDVPNRFERVSVKIDLWNDRLVFSHNGDYFTTRNLTGLIQQVSSKDSANQGVVRQTGKFGTGFITTHLLSKIIEVYGVVKNPNTDRFHRFNLILDRSAKKSEDLIDGIVENITWVKKLDEDDIDTFPLVTNYEDCSEEDFNTSFTYHLVNEDSVKSAQVGIDDLVNTLPITMVSIHKIKSVHVINHITGTDQLYLCDNEILVHDDKYDIIRSSVKINEVRKYFLTYVTYDEKMPKVALSIETVWDGSAYYLVGREKTQPVLFRDFPLIGSEEFYFPFMLNGFDFEPTEPRDGILLNKNEDKSQKNRVIIDCAVEAALKFNEWLVANNAKKTYLIASTREPKPTNTWDSDYAQPWIDNLIKSWRDRIVNQPLVETYDGYMAVSELRIPYYSSTSKTANKKFYEFLNGFITDGCLPLQNQQIEWEDVIKWNKDLLVTKEMFLEDLSQLGSVSELSSRIEKNESDTYEWLNSLYAFIVDQGNLSLFDEYAIIPNQKGEFKLLENLSCDADQRIPNEMKSLAEGLIGRDLKDELLCEEIDESVLTGIDSYDFNSLIKEQNDILSDFVSQGKYLNDSAWNDVSDFVCDLMGYTTTIDEDFSKKRLRMYTYVCMFHTDMADMLTLENLPKNLWKEADKFIIKATPYLIEHFASTIEGICNTLLDNPQAHSEEECISWLNEYRNLALENEIPIPHNKNIYPNQLGELKSLDYLYFDAAIPEALKTLYLTATDEDIKDVLLDKRIVGYDSHDPYNVADLYEKIKEKFESRYTDADKLLEISKAALSLFPSSQKSGDSLCHKLYRLYKILDSNISDIQIIENSQGFYWNIFHAHALKYVCSEIAESENVSSLSEHTGLDFEDAVNYVDEVVELTESCYSKNYASYVNEDYGLWINQNGDFCMLSDISRDKDVDPIAIEIAAMERVGGNYKETLMMKGLKSEIFVPTSQVLTTRDVLKTIDDSIRDYDSEGRSLQAPSFAELILKMNSFYKKHAEYKDATPYFDRYKDKLIVGSIGEEKTLSVISELVASPEKLDLIQKLNKLSTDQLQNFIYNNNDITALTEKVKELQDKIAQLTNTENGEEINTDDFDVVVTPKDKILDVTTPFASGKLNINAVQYSGLSLEEIVAYVTEAKRAVVNYFKDLGGYTFDKERIALDSYSQLYGIYGPDGKELPLVVHSYRGPHYRYFDLNWYDWQLLEQPGSMLWIMTTSGLQCIPLYALPVRNVNMNIEQAGSNSKAALLTLASVGQHYSKSSVCFDFGNNMPQNFKKAIPFDFVPDKLTLGIESIKKVCDELIPSLADVYTSGASLPIYNDQRKLTDEIQIDTTISMKDLHDLPAAGINVENITLLDSEEAIL